MSALLPKQMRNKELAASKAKLQVLNEKLTALNSQLHETVEQQRATYNDLQNILISTDVATLLLDCELNIRFFTPAAKSLFDLVASDVGRPLADLTRRFEDEHLLPDARAVLAKPRAGQARSQSRRRRLVHARDPALSKSPTGASKASSSRLPAFQR